MANLPTITTAVLAEVVLRLYAEPAAASTTADVLQPEPRRVGLLREDNTTSFQWSTALITETHPGKDSVVRVVTLKTS